MTAFAPSSFERIVVRQGVDLKTFNDEIRAACSPVVLHDAVAHRPIMPAGREAPRAPADYIRRCDRAGTEIHTDETFTPPPRKARTPGESRP